ncbi:MAG TPA: hypothetical protein VMU14_23025, partial [Acidimicrobiales bacterium]|nr:hypothetical protein [Acidimicrobiales bacterium]
MRHGVAAGLAAGLLAAGLVAACSGGRAPVPPPTTTGPTSTTGPAATTVDPASVQLPVVGGQVTEPPIAVTPGPASLNGTVTDTTGAAVAAATVQLQRIVGARSASTQVTSAPDGTWSVQGILGGVYRVRAWRVPDLAQPAATVVFVSATAANPAVVLTVDPYAGTSVQAAVAPNPPPVGTPANLVVEVTTASVGDDGVARQVPEPGAVVAIDASGDWSITGAGTQTTGPNGQVAWEATCEAPGQQAVSVSVDGATAVGLALPACAAPP